MALVAEEENMVRRWMVAKSRSALGRDEVRCGYCRATGLVLSQVEAGSETARSIRGVPREVCPKCRGKGVLTPKDRRRNRAYAIARARKAASSGAA